MRCGSRETPTRPPSTPWWRHAERALQAARDELERRVERRTRDLTAANEELEGEIASRAQAEQALRKREKELEETNTALKILLQRVEASKDEFEEQILWNINELIFPYPEKIETGVGR